MAYNIQYQISFSDIHQVPATWRIDMLEKNGVVRDTPIQITNVSAEPLVIEWENTEEDKFSPIIGSKATIQYIYDADPLTPVPETFINIQEDTWLVNIYKNDLLYWKGFVKPDNASYPWIYPPYTFSIECTDYFQYMKGLPVNLDDNIQFIYDHITIADFLNRTIFYALGYEDAVINVINEIKPDVLVSGDNWLQQLYVHTDAFYDFDKGANFIYDALQKVCASFKMRIFFSAGAYWLYRVSDGDQEDFTYFQYKKSDLSVTQISDAGITKTLGSSDVHNDVYYSGVSQNLRINPGLKQYNAVYQYQAINQLVNFDFRTYNLSYPEFPNWVNNIHVGLNLTRTGSGTLADLYRAHMEGVGGLDQARIISNSTAQIAQGGSRVQIKFKAYSYWTSGIKVQVGIFGTGVNDKTYILQSDGSWLLTDDLANEEAGWILYAPTKNPDFVTIDITSKPMPIQSTLQYVTVTIDGPFPPQTIDPLNPEPPGVTRYNEIYPVFLKLYKTQFTELDTKIINADNYSLIPSDDPLFFLDTQDGYLSNTIFYNNSGVKTPLPANNWANQKSGSLPKKTLQEIVSDAELAQAAIPTYNFEGDVYSNTLSMHNTILLTDLDNKKTMILHDTYKVRSCIHSLVASEITNDGTGIGTYTATPVTKD